MGREPKVNLTAFASDVVSGMYRFTIPIRSLIETGMATGNVYVGTAHNLEITPNSPILLQRHLALPTPVVTTLKSKGCRIVQDLDDLLWSIPSDNPNAEVFSPAMLAALNCALESADVVTVSTQPLAEAVRKRGIDPFVIPNVLDVRDWTVQPRRAPRKRPRVGWYGQRLVHIADLTIIEHAVREMTEEADFVFLGDVPSGLADLRNRVECHPAVPLSLFPTMLAALDLDLMLAPLAQNEFNECKSNLRLLQAGMLGYPVVASDIEPHRTLPVTRVAGSGTAWVAAIRERLHDRSELRLEGESLRDAVHAHYLARDWAPRYLGIWTGDEVPAHA
jgi:hypothetical protein